MTSSHRWFYLIRAFFHVQCVLPLKGNYTFTTFLITSPASCPSILGQISYSGVSRCSQYCTSLKFICKLLEYFNFGKKRIPLSLRWLNLFFIIDCFHPGWCLVIFFSMLGQAATFCSVISKNGANMVRTRLNVTNWEAIKCDWMWHFSPCQGCFVQTYPMAKTRLLIH